MVVEDLFNLEQLGEVALSPSGEWLAVVIIRARTAAETYRGFDAAHGDIWLVPSGGGERRNITNGAADGSGYWNPVWSPDGKRLAMLSTKGRDHVRPFVWDMVSGQVRQLTERGADLRASNDEGWPHYGMIWGDNATVLCAVLPEDAPGHIHTMIGSYAKAVRSWAEAARGLEPTASVLDSGREIPSAARPMGALLAIDVVSGTSRVLAKGNFRNLLFSPTGRHLALIAETGRVPPSPAMERLRHEGHAFALWRTRLAILKLEDGAEPRWIEAVHDPAVAAGDEPPPGSWSPDGSSFAVIGKATEGDELRETGFLVSAATGQTRLVSGPQTAVSAMTWSRQGTLLALARQRAGRNGDSTRVDWWSLQPGKGRSERKVTGRLRAVPTALLPTPGQHEMIGIASGDLWSVDIRTGLTTNLTDTLDAEIHSLVWPTGFERVARGGATLILEAKNKDHYGITWTGGRPHIRKLKRPSGGAAIAAFSPERRLTAWSAVEPTGTFLWVDGGRGGEVVPSLVLNPHVRVIADAERRLVSYLGVDGDSLQALLVLPIGYRPGRRYPLVTWVYPANTITDSFYFHLDKQFVSSLNLSLLPAHGYALLIPSVPVKLTGPDVDLYIDLPKGVTGAVDEVVRLGIADPAKLGVMGHSAGGYGVYTLTAYTHRFKAAVAIAGPANFVSQYGVFDPTLRYDDYPHEDLHRVSILESGLALEMGGPPWQHLWRYLRNSPLYFVDRIRTPLMMIHGDMDFVPLQQSEEMFTALYRSGKTARLIRYWGEGHVPTSPANVRDLWRRVFEWFDEYLKGDTLPDRPTPGSALPTTTH